MRRGSLALRAGLTMFFENVRMSLSNIRQNRLRSALTILGILIGVTAVIALITTVNGVSTSISSSFTSMGAGSLSVSVSGSDLKSGLAQEELAQLAQIEHVEGVVPSVTLSARVSKGKNYASSVSIAGRNSYWFEINQDALVRGRAINILDEQSMNYVCLIDAEMVETFFYGEDPLEQTLYIGGNEFLVVGVFDSESDTSISSMMGGTPSILIPYTTANRLNSTSLITAFTVYTDAPANAQGVMTQMQSAMDAMFSYEEDCYEITTMESIESTMEEMLSMISALLAGIASIALLVGGIGIMNMMLTSVTERTVEIGLKKALGARSGQIQSQFLMESCVFGGGGRQKGVARGQVQAAIMWNPMGTGFAVSYGAIALGVGFSAFVGIVFGWAPARKASRLNPIEALRRT